MVTLIYLHSMLNQGFYFGGNSQRDSHYKFEKMAGACCIFKSMLRTQPHSACRDGVHVQQSHSKSLKTPEYELAISKTF